MKQETEESEESKQEKLKFEVVQKREGLTQYIFPNVVLNINFQQEVTRGAPELVYATYDRDPGEASLDKPAYKRQGVNMQYVVECIQTAAKDLGETRFWVYPHDGDSLGAEQRVEQWKKHFGLEIAPEQGYYINL